MHLNNWRFSCEQNIFPKIACPIIHIPKYLEQFYSCFTLVLSTQKWFSNVWKYISSLTILKIVLFCNYQKILFITLVAFISFRARANKVTVIIFTSLYNLEYIMNYSIQTTLMKISQTPLYITQEKENWLKCLYSVPSSNFDRHKSRIIII